MPSPEAPPYVSLLDQLHELSDTLSRVGGHQIAPSKVPAVLSALVYLYEHGADLLDARGSYTDVEAILTPDRPDGWNGPTGGPLPDDRDRELTALRAKLAGYEQSTQSNQDF